MCLGPLVTSSLGFVYDSVVICHSSFAILGFRLQYTRDRAEKFCREKLGGSLANVSTMRERRGAMEIWDEYPSDGFEKILSQEHRSHKSRHTVSFVFPSQVEINNLHHIS